MEFSTYTIDSMLPLIRDEYFTFLNHKIRDARKRIWSAIFIVNPTVGLDTSLAIRHLLKNLAYAKWKNVDVKVIVGTSGVRDIQVANNTTMLYLQELGIPVRRYIGGRRRSLHSKYVVIDDELIIVGSHNWTPGAVAEHNEDSIAVYSQNMNTLLRDEFTSNWQNALEVEGSMNNE